MKNKIRVLTGMLIMILLLTAGCGKKETLAYDQQTITQITEFMIDYSSSADEQTVEQLKAMRESTFEDQLANMNLSITPDHFVSVVEAWKAGEKECGAYVDHGAYTIEATADELHVTTEAKFQNRDAEPVSGKPDCRCPLFNGRDSEKSRNEYTPGNGNGICGTDTDLFDYFIIQIYTGNAGAYEE